MKIFAALLQAWGFVGLLVNGARIVNYLYKMVLARGGAVGFPKLETSGIEGFTLSLICTGLGFLLLNLNTHQPGSVEELDKAQ